jgi:hypothetical protein
MLALTVIGGCGRVRFQLLDDAGVEADAHVDGAADTGPGLADTGVDGAQGGDASDAAPGADAGQPCVDTRTYPGGGIEVASFAGDVGLALNGTAGVVGDVLRLAGVSPHDGVGTAFFEEAVPIEPGVSVFVHFGFHIHGGNGESGADGMTFILQNTPNGAEALGGGGGGMGYNGLTPSVAVELDTFDNPSDPDGNHIALLADGVMNPALATVSPSFTLNDGTLRYLWVDFDGGTDRVEVYVADAPTKPETPILTHDGIDLFDRLGGQLYLGWSAATGSYVNNHDVVGPAWLVVSPLPKCR